MIWNAATDLVHAGGVDAWDFKQYVLGTMFYRYISENITEYINEGEHAAGNAEFDYAKMSDEDAEQARQDLVDKKGFFALSGLLKEQKQIENSLNNIVSAIEQGVVQTRQKSDCRNLKQDNKK